MNEFEMFLVILDYADKNELYDRFDDLELELSEIKRNAKEWGSKVKKIYNEMKRQGLV